VCVMSVCVCVCEELHVRCVCICVWVLVVGGVEQRADGSCVCVMCV